MLGKIYQTRWPRRREPALKEGGEGKEMRVETSRPEGVLGTVLYFITLFGIAAVGVVALYKSASGVKS